jgi:hypothetical protein
MNIENRGSCEFVYYIDELVYSCVTAGSNSGKRSRDESDKLWILRNY